MSPLPLVFTSGSCRLLATIGNGRSQLNPLHALEYNFIGTNCITKLHTIHQHVQFVQHILGINQIPEDDWPYFFTQYSHWRNHKKFQTTDLSDIPKFLQNIKDQFHSADVYIFEICSLKMFISKNGTHLQVECLPSHIQKDDYKECSYLELVEQITYLRNLIPKEKPILLMCPFDVESISSRKLVHTTIRNLTRILKNVHILDPNYIINKHGKQRMLVDPLHFSIYGYDKFFNYIVGVIKNLKDNKNA